MALARWQATIVDEAGNVVPGASIEVRREIAGAPLVPLYSDRAGAVAIGNPFTADSEGFAAFHAAGGAYRVRAHKGSFERIWRYVGIGLASETDLTLTTPMGAWDSGTTYPLGALVTHEDGGPLYLFISRVEANLDNEPDADTPDETTEWMFAGEAVAGPAGTGDKYTIAIGVEGRPRDGGTLLRHVFEAAVTFASGLTGSRADADTASTGEAVFSITKNGSPVGTVTFDTSDTGSFAMASQTEFQAGDVIRVIAPSPRDATLADLSITLAGDRSA